MYEDGSQVRRQPAQRSRLIASELNNPLAASTRRRQIEPYERLPAGHVSVSGFASHPQSGEYSELAPFNNSIQQQQQPAQTASAVELYEDSKNPYLILGPHQKIGQSKQNRPTLNSDPYYMDVTTTDPNKLGYMTLDPDN